MSSQFMGSVRHLELFKFRVFMQGPTYYTRVNCILGPTPPIKPGDKHWIIIVSIRVPYGWYIMTPNNDVQVDLNENGHRSDVVSDNNIRIAPPLVLLFYNTVNLRHNRITSVLIWLKRAHKGCQFEQSVEVEQMLEVSAINLLCLNVWTCTIVASYDF